MSYRRTFNGTDLTKFLEALETFMHRPQRMVIVGFAAATIKFGFDDLAHEIETRDEVETIQDAINFARATSGLDVTVKKTSSKLQLMNLDSRLNHFELKSGSQLEVLIPDAVDLIVLALENLGLDELVMIERLTKFNQITAEELLDRFERDASVETTARAEVEFNLHLVLEYCFSNSVESLTDH